MICCSRLSFGKIQLKEKIKILTTLGIHKNHKANLMELKAV